ncbi:MAG: DUF6391 domain-containing protein [Chloroflexota bacterium]|nr:DUF6391 domain-containing protein [Dehalococcoidia bacterium]MDW8252295.1 DUF6391 domain-containing protein [Chloroflexota bacterium]
MPLPLLDATRANHALEHATITILLGRLSRPVRMVGRATPGGFYLHGDVPTAELTAAVEEALARLQAGEARLAISPLCGTNLAVAGVLAGLSSVLAFSAANRPDRWLRAILAATGAVLLAQPLGQLVQRHVTTSPNLRGMRIKRILRTGRGAWTIHRVETAWS